MLQKYGDVNKHQLGRVAICCSQCKYFFMVLTCECKRWVFRSALQYAHEDLPGRSEKTAHFFSISNSLSFCHVICMYLWYELRNNPWRAFLVGLAELNNALLELGWVEDGGGGHRKGYQRHDPAPMLVNENFTTEVEAFLCEKVQSW